MRVRLVALAALLGALPAAAFPSLIKHNYASCAACHVDPSGGGITTAYGKAQASPLLEMTYGRPAKETEEGEPNRFLGLVALPDWLLGSFDFRAGALVTQTRNPAVQPVPAPAVRPFQMATDLRAAVVADAFRASASLGFAAKRAELASLTPTGPGGERNVVSREHWLGLSLLDDALLVRAGRINLPYGIRTVEHTLWTKALTRTDINEHQQHGVAAAWNGDQLRAEVMAIAGNFQLHPDYYRERGYSGYVEWAIEPTLAAGMSSLLTVARLGLDAPESWPARQAHGVFARKGIGERLFLAAEANLLLHSADGVPLQPGYAAWLQADWEPIRGLHGIVSLEGAKQEGVAGGSSLGAWVGLSWFAWRAVEVRVDGYVRRLPVSGGAPVQQYTLIAQLHLYP